MEKPSLIQGGKHIDHRGVLNYFNLFEMTEVRRFYMIEHADITVERGWRGHRIEQRWFVVVAGAFIVKVVEINNWQKPDPNVILTQFELKAEENQVLHVPKGYATLLQALVANAKILVFADSKVENALLDDHLFPVDYFKA